MLISDDHKSNFAAFQILLVTQVLVCSQQQIEPCRLCCGKSEGILPRPAFGPGGPGGPGGGPGGPGGPEGGLGGMLARPIFEATDKNNDGQLSTAELKSATESLLKKWDKNNNGQLDEKELAAAINGLLPPPPGGPPGGPNRRPPSGP